MLESSEKPKSQPDDAFLNHKWQFQIQRLYEKKNHQPQYELMIDFLFLFINYYLYYENKLFYNPSFSGGGN